jgi:hypothetical protein
VKINNLFLLCAFSLLLATFCSQADSQKVSPISVEIVRAYSDGLSVSLEAALKQRINHSTDFTIGRHGKSDLELVIAEPVKVKVLANSTQVSYKVNFLSRQDIVSVSVGNCWQEQMSECAEQILRDAKLSQR